MQLRDNRYSKEEALAVEFSKRCPLCDANGDESPYTPEEWVATVESIYSRPPREPWSEPVARSGQPPDPAAEIPFVDPAKAESQGVPKIEIPDTADLLTKISVFTLRFVHMSGEQATVGALWVIHTHAIDAADFTPYLDIHSPMLRSGKTRLLEVLNLLVRNPWFTGRTTPSSLVRKIDTFHSTLLLDESDAALEGKNDYTEALRGILNTGFERGGMYTMSVPKGKDWEPRDFSTFGPKAIAGIGKELPTTVKDRSIPFDLKRRLKSEPVERFRKRKVKPDGMKLQKQASDWAQANIDVLSQAEPALPEELDDRRCDVIEPLLAIADLAGGEWPEQARKALKDLCGVSADSEEASLLLLADIRSLFRTENKEELRTESLLGSLAALSESPWREYNRNSSLSARQLAGLLQPFDIRPRDIHEIGSDRKTFRGYRKADFKDAWERYLPPDEGEEELPKNESSGPAPSEPAQHPRQPRQANVYAGPSDFSHSRQEASGADEKSEESPINTRGGVGGVDEGPIPSTGDGENQWPSESEWVQFGDQDVPTEESS